MNVRIKYLLLIGPLMLWLGLRTAAASPPVVMKLLVLTGSTTEGSYQSITTFLSEIGVPYQAIVLSSIKADASGNRLSSVPFSDSATGQGSYQGIILTDSTFAACTPSCLSTADWTTLNTYAAQFSVRVASYFTDPAAQWGLLPADSGLMYTAASPLNVALTGAGAAVFTYLNSANAIPVSGGEATGIRVYRATTTAAANETTTALITSGSYTVAATHTTADGRETLALTMDNAPSLLHSQAFAYGIINWVTRGIFLGSRKVYLNPEADDLLLGNWIYAPTQHPACENGNTCPTYFMTGPDLQAQANWQANLRTDPQFESYRGTFAFNGVGTTWFSPSDPIFSAMKSLNTQFWWLSHTWDHPDLDCYSQSNNGTCISASSAQSLSELNQNISVAPSLGITLDRSSLVTPYNSGLGDANFVEAAAQLGIQYIVYPQYPATPNTGIVNEFVPSILEITRMNNDLFYDASSPDTGVYGSWPDEYNDQYGPNGATPVYSQNQTYSQILNILSQEFLQTNMLTYAPYPLAFHIANMASYDGTHSVFSDVMDATITKYKTIFDLPVISLDLEDIGTLMKNRASYNSSGVVGVYTPGVSVALTANKAGTIPITGACSQSACGTYGGQIQDDVVMAAGSTVTLSLTAGSGVTLSSVVLNPTSVTSGLASSGNITLSGVAPAGGLSVTLSSNSAAATVPASVTVAAGSSTASFSVATTSVTSSTSATITASYNNVSKTAILTITPAGNTGLSTVTVSPTTVSSGTTATGTVTLASAAPTGGISVALSSSVTSATIPSSTTVPAGSTTASFTITATSVAYTTPATITASYNGASKSAALTIAPSALVALSSVSVDPTSVTNQLSATGTVTLNTAAPAGGVVVELWTTGTVAFVPDEVIIAAGATTGTFIITTNYTNSTLQDTVTAFYNGASKTAGITVTP